MNDSVSRAPGAGTSLVHGAVTVTSEERARRVFQELFGLELIKRGTAGAELCRALFDIDAEAPMLLYGAGPASVEVFLWADMPQGTRRHDHLCLAVSDLQATTRRAERLGFEVRRFPKGDRDVLFIRDEDGNLYEIKAPD